MKTQRILGWLSFLVLPQLFVATVHAQDSVSNVTSNTLGMYNGFNYEFWKDGPASGVLTLGSNGTFRAEWKRHGRRANILMRKGRKFDETQTHQQLGNITVEFDAAFRATGRSYFCIYGWTVEPLMEFYIIESWGSVRPGGQHKATITVDGHTYDVYQSTRRNQPSIKGRATFEQYWSVRRQKRTSGTVSVSEHFKAWEALGMKMGKMYEVALTAEGWESSGEANVTHHVLTIGNTRIGGQAER